MDIGDFTVAVKQENGPTYRINALARDLAEWLETTTGCAKFLKGPFDVNAVDVERHMKAADRVHSARSHAYRFNWAVYNTVLDQVNNSKWTKSKATLTKPWPKEKILTWFWRLAVLACLCGLVAGNAQAQWNVGGIDRINITEGDDTLKKAAVSPFTWKWEDPYSITVSGSTVTMGVDLAWGSWPFERTANKGIANGYAGLDAGALVPTDQLGTGGADNTKFLRGDQTWQVLSSDHSLLSNLDYASAGHTDFAGTEVSNTFNASQLIDVLGGFEVTDTIRFRDGPNYGTFLGKQTADDDEGEQNLFVGFQAGMHNSTGGGGITGTLNVYIGYHSGFGNGWPTNPNTGSNNLGLGYRTLNWNQTGSGNVAIGSLSMRQNTIGINNTAVGYWSQRVVTNPRYNTSLGYRTLELAGNARYSTAMGAFAFSKSGGNYNTGVGYATGTNLTSGIANVFIGAWAGGRQTSASNTFIIDNQDRGSAGAEVTNAMFYGNFHATASSQWNKLNGYFGINVQPSFPLEVQGLVAATVVSVFQGAASQSGNLTEWQDSNGTELANVDAKGTFNALTGTATDPPIQLTDGTALSSPVQGALEFFNNRLMYTNGVTQRTPDRTNDVALAFTTVENTTTETTVWTGTVYSEEIQAGLVIRVHGGGLVSNATAADDITINIYLEDTLAMSFNPTMLNVTDAPWHYNVELCLQTTNLTYHGDAHIGEFEEEIIGYGAHGGYPIPDRTITIKLQWDNAKAANVATHMYGYWTFRN